MTESIANFFFNQNYITENLSAMTPALITSLLVILALGIFYYITSRLLLSALSKTALRPSLVEITVKSLYKWIIVIFGIIFVLSQVGVDVTAALAGVGVVGIAIGFAAKETLANVMSGFGIFIEDLYRRGDWVEIVGQYGQVKDITLRTTKIRTLDNVYIILPNAKVTMEPVTNYSEKGMVRITIKVSIAYNESIEAARNALLAAVRAVAGVKDEPGAEPEVVADELGDSGVELLVRVWLDDPGTYKRVHFALTEACKQALDEAGITIPFPQRDVHMKQ